MVLKKTSLCHRIILAVKNADATVRDKHGTEQAGIGASAEILQSEIREAQEWVTTGNSSYRILTRRWQ